ncbi:MAG: sigma-70 family RNA polymerase sigma factor [bacterium]|nr:sigma-70 family RNA polymerase sigma factor [bacterium]
MTTTDITEAIEAAFVAYRCTRDAAAFEVVYDRTAPRLLAVAVRALGDAGLAEDAVHETYLFALENSERWNPEQPLEPWLLTILGYRLKKARTRRARAVDARRFVHSASAVIEPGDDVARGEEVMRIDHAISCLAQPYRSVLMLRFRRGLRPVDIAVALDRTPGTVRAQLTRGLEMLRRALPTASMVLLSELLSAASAARSASTAVVRDRLRARVVANRRPLTGVQRWLSLRDWGMALLGCAVAWFAWSAWLSEPTPHHDPITAKEQARATSVASAAAEPVGPPGVESRLAPLREPVPLTGALRVIVEQSGNPLPFAGIELEPLADPPHYLVHQYVIGKERWREIESSGKTAPESFRRARTAAAGEHVFSQLPVGSWICRALNQADVIRIEAGVTKEVRLAVDPRSVTVRGRVLDCVGAPVRNAEVWCCDETRKTAARVLTVTGADGRFVAAVSPFTTIGAVRAGSASVAQTLTPDNTGRYAEVTLRFCGAGAALSGRVVGHDGCPVAGAEVEVGHANDARVGSHTVVAGEVARRMRTITDASGRFAFESLAPGQTVVVAHLAGFGVGRDIVDLRRRSESSVELCLPLAAIVTGTVRDVRGRPVAGAHVRVSRANKVGHSSCTTDDAGRYRLTSVTPGRPTVEVVDYRGSYAFRVVSCAAGESVTWDPVLSPDNLRLAGRVVDSQGRPYRGGWIVHGAHWQVRALPLDENGGFDLVLSERVAAIPSGIRVFAGDPRGPGGQVVDQPVAGASGLRSGSTDLEITVPARVACDCELRGRLGAVPADCTRFAFLGKANGRTWREPVVGVRADGGFVVGGLEPGSYVLRDEVARREVGPFQLEAGGCLDIGLVRVAPVPVESRRCVIHLALLFPHDVSATEQFRFEVRDEQDWIVARGGQGASIVGRDVFLELPRGVLDLEMISGSGLVARHRLEIDPDRPPLRAVPVVFAPR